MIIGGVDPGINGGISFFNSDTHELIALACPIITTVKIKNKINNKFLPTKIKTKNKEYDISKISELFIIHKPDICFIESIHSMPGQGVHSTFFFGKGYGILLGIIGALQIKRIDVTPQKWKKHFSLINKDKSQSILKASEYFPKYVNCWKLKKHDGIAESALIAYYGNQILNDI